MKLKKISKIVLAVAAIALALILIQALTVSIYRFSTILAAIVIAISIISIYEFVHSKIQKNKQ